LPFIQDIYRPMLKRLKAEGIVAEEKSTWIWISRNFLDWKFSLYQEQLILLRLG
jgi:hypothetical protein